MCLDMNRLIAITILLVSCSEEEQRYPWFEDNWISDTEATLDANPNYRDLNPEGLNAVREMLGQIRWEISDSTLHFFDDRYDQIVTATASFYTNPIDEESFEMVTDHETRIIWRTDTGFCTVLESEHLAKFGVADDDTSLECFRPTGT